MSDIKLGSKFSYQGTRIIIFAALLSAMLVGLYFLNFSGPLSDSHELWAMFGDFIGGTLNPVLTFLSLIVIVFSLQHQVIELSESTNALKAQSEHLETQAFESAFFNVVATYRDKKAKLSYIDGPNSYHAEDVFPKLSENLKRSYQVVSKHERSNDEMDLIIKSVQKFVSQSGKSIEHYFLDVHGMILLLIARRKNIPQHYWDYFSCQIDQAEAIILFYVIFYEGGKEEVDKFRSMGFFRRANEDFLINKKSHLPLIREMEK